MLPEIKKWLLEQPDMDVAIQQIKDVIFEVSPKRHNPIENVRWVDLKDVEANNYNPNAVALQEMKLLYTSIMHDGYTQPIVTIYDEEKRKYIIVDGFHRHCTMEYNEDLKALNGAKVPIVVIEKDINDRMASTIRHNRARGKHSTDGMSNIVLNMLKNGWDDVAVCNELGLETEELVRLKHITGFSKLYADREFSKSWETTHQLELKRKYKKEHPND
jgi:ParB-like chromosome segregation protein Spo0J